ncbi:MAG: DUF4197 domain-containing protein [Candidatus Brocadiaceae bacterium]|nr:DUF4197 domain-containing protein [Candidatus Brocadiaceae bacterium]
MIIFLLSCACLITGCKTTEKFLSSITGGEILSNETIIAGLKEALIVGTENAVSKTSTAGGFYNNALIRIGMPEELEKLSSTMRKIGFGEMIDTFEMKMNEAAENAASQATPVFVEVIKGMTITDATKILYGKDTAATDYFRKKTTQPLTDLYSPVVNSHMKQVGVVNLYNDLIDLYTKIPFVKKPRFSLDKYIVDSALKGMFTVIAEEEKKIREDPLARTTELLRKVFAVND